jgi:hypothetical protein
MNYEVKLEAHNLLIFSFVPDFIKETPFVITNPVT